MNDSQRIQSDQENNIERICKCSVNPSEMRIKLQIPQNRQRGPSTANNPTQTTNERNLFNGCLNETVHETRNPTTRNWFVLSEMNKNTLHELNDCSQPQKE